MIDVVNNNDDNIEEKVLTDATLRRSENDEIEEETEAGVVEVKPVQAELLEPVKVEDKQDYKSIRTQQLIGCPKCSKMMTATSLKYYHKKNCPAEEKAVPIDEIKQKTKLKIKVPETIKIVEDEVSFSEEEVKIIKPKKQKGIILEQPVLTYQEQRLQYINNQKNNRQHKFNCLFMGAV